MKKKKLIRIAKNLAFDLDSFITGTQGILAKKRRGKSYTAQVEAEELLELGQQVVVLDPTGAWWGLRSSADGKSAGYPITIFGGEHADAPLEPTAGEMIATAIVADGFSAVIDLTNLRKGERLRFATDFMETLYRLNRSAMHLFIDEADVFAPQVPRDPQASRLLGATDELVRRGGLRGIGVTMISQRPQVVNNDVLSQIDMLTVLNMNHPKDLKAIENWISDHVNRSTMIDMMQSLPSLPVGTAWVWAPEAMTFERVDVRRKRTFDSGRTPRAGERAAPPKVLAKIDVERLGAAIRETVERAKANDPKALRERVAALTKQVEKLEAAKPTKPGKTITKEVIGDAQLKRLEKVFERADRAQQPLTEELRIIRGLLIKAGVHAPTEAPPPSRGGAAQIEKLAATLPNPQEGAAQYHARAGVGPKPPRDMSRRTSTEALAAIGGKLPPGEAKILEAVIQYGGLERDQMSVIVGFKRSTRDAYLSRLRDKGFIVSDDRGLSIPTPAGIACMPNVGPRPSGADLQRRLAGELPPGEWKVLELAIADYPKLVERSHIDESTGFARSSRDAYISRLKARRLVMVERGGIRAAASLVETT